MSTTPNYGWPLLATNQASPEVTHNDAITDIDRAFGGLFTKAMSDANYTLDVSAVPSEASYLSFMFTGTLTADRNIIVPTNKKLYSVWNNTTTPYNLTVKTSGGSGVAVPFSASAAYVLLYCDGTNVVSIGSQSSGGGGVAEFTPEQFGAVGDGSTDDTTAIQDAINAAASNGGGTVVFDAKTYAITSALSITTSNVRMRGVSALASQIKTTSASINMLTIAGSGTFPTSGLLFNNRVSDLGFIRTTSPTGTAKGISLSLTDTCSFERVQVSDSIYCFYHSGNGNALTSYFQCEALFTSVTATAGSVYGWYIDGGNFGSFSGRNIDGIVNNLGSTATTLYGMYMTGNYVADLYCEGFESSLCHYGVYINALTSGDSNYGESAYNNDNIHFVRCIHDNCKVAAYYITNLYGANSYVELNGGYVVSFTGVNTPLIDIENSAGVIVSSMNIRAGGGATATNPGVYIHGSNSKNNVVSGNVFYIQNAGTPIVVEDSNRNVINNNAVYGYAGAPFAIGIKLINASFNAVNGNNLSGTGTTGISLDSNSNSNTGAGNIVDTTDVTNDLIDAGVNSIQVNGATRINTQTTDYQAVGSDNDNVVNMNGATSSVSLNFTIPANATVAFPIGAVLTVTQTGASPVVLNPAVGVTINTPSSLTTRAGWSTVSVVKIATNTWVASGDLT